MKPDWIEQEKNKCKWLLNEKLKTAERNAIQEYLRSLEEKRK